MSLYPAEPRDGTLTASVLALARRGRIDLHDAADELGRGFRESG